jgi:uncharacterized protein (UPF0548 family)
MFSFSRPTPLILEKQLTRARTLSLSYAQAIETRAGLEGVHAPAGFALDHTHSEIGRGADAFETAKSALRRWRHFDLGWVRVANPDVAIEPGWMVAVEAHALGLWSLNLSRILYVIDEPERFGFGYGTTAMHVERGEERFLVEFDRESGAVDYDLLAVSRPAHWVAMLGYPYTRSRQRRFARESHQRMRALAGSQ